MQKVLVTFSKMLSFQTFLLLIVTLCVSWKSAIAARVCSAEWACKSGDCIATENLCDGIPHCRDGSDETKASCKGMQCSFASFRCDYGACILLDFVCDGIRDCVDSSDEDSEMCLKRRNDLLNDEIDEEIKRKKCIDDGQMECWSGQCISITDKCNGVEDCEDGSDELYSLCQTILCKQHQFQCDYGACLPMKAKCNGTKECFDGSDEYEGLCKKEIATDFEAIENYEKDLTTTPEVDISLIALTTNTKTNVTSINENETMIVQKTSVHSPAATTSAENFDWFKYFKKPFEHTQVKIPQINKNQTFPIDIRNSTPSKQLKSNENKGQEVREYPIRLAFLDPILYTLNVTTQTPNLKVNLSSSPNNSIVSNLSIQSLITSPPLTSAVTHIPETLNATEKSPNNPGSITKTLSNRYSDTTTNKATTEVRTQCILRSCDFPLICNILLSSTQDSGRLHVKQARQSLFEGSEVVFNCADGYVLEGVSRITCKTNGWSHKIPSCIPCCDADFKLSCTPPLKCVYEEPNISTKQVITKDFTDTVVRENFKLSFECAEGYLLEGSKIRKCTAKGWSNVMPRCVNQCDVLELGIPKFPLKCQMLDSLTGLTNGCQYSPWRRKLKEGSYFEYSCENGYNLHGVNRSTCLNSGWNSDAPSCVPLCDLKLIRPCQSPLICKGNQKWPRPPRPLFSFANMSDGATLDLTEDLVVDFSCEVGYELVGAKVITCSKNGWSHGIPTCKKSDCDDSILDDCTYPLICWRYYFEMREYTRIYKGSVQKLSQNEKLFISCENDYLLSGNNYLTCKGGKWNGTMPKCIEPSCRADLLPKCENPMICTAYDCNSGRGQDIINNYGESSKTFPKNTMVIFNCTDGHVLNGVKTATCNNHGWKYDGDIYNSECQRIFNTCDKGILDNCTYPLICERFDSEFGDFKKIQSASSQKSISDAEQIKFSCEYGYVLDGRNALTCKGGKWDGTMPKCIVHSCSADLLPECKYPLTCTRYDSEFKSEQIIIDNSFNESTNYALNTKIVYGCAEGFKLKGEEQTICSSNGWSHVQSLKLPQCISPCDLDIFKSCKPPLFCYYFDPEMTDWLTVDNSSVINYVAKNSIVGFNCEYGFKLQGSRSISCDPEGWNEPISKCVK